MPNHKEKKDGKQVNKDLEILLAVEMGILSFLKKRNICFNPRPFTNPIHIKNKQEKLEREQKDLEKEISLIDLHLEITKKVDALIEKIDKETKPETIQTEFFTKKQPVVSVSYTHLRAHET